MMTAADFVDGLVQATLASSAAVVLVLLLRRQLRSGFGAGVAYAAWALVPATLLVLAIPGPSLRWPATLPVSTFVPEQVVAVAVSQPAVDPSGWILAMWMAGVVAMLVRLAWQQLRFQHAMGTLLQRPDGTWQSGMSRGLPAVVGMLPSRIVVPRDFEQRYDARERLLMLAHERVHLARGDVRWNALATVVRSVFWFNPLLHAANTVFRNDQELACDQRVIAGHPDARHAYGEAMLKTQLATQSLPLGCHWGHGHPLKERLEMLKQPVPTSRRLLAGSALVVTLVSGGAYAACASQPPTVLPADAPSAAVDFTAEIGLGVDGAATRDFRVANRFGAPFSVRTEDSRGAFDVEAIVAPVMHEGAQAYRIDAKVSRNGQLQASPALVVLAGSPATIRQGESSADGRFEGIELTMRVLPTATVQPMNPKVQPAKQAIASRANQWSSYEQLVGSLSASWEPPKPAEEGC